MLAVSVSGIWRMECGSHSSLCRALHFQPALQVTNKSCREARGSLSIQNRLPLDVLSAATFASQAVTRGWTPRKGFSLQGPTNGVENFHLIRFCIAHFRENGRARLSPLFPRGAV